MDVITSRGFAFERLGNGDIVVYHRGYTYGVWQTRVDGCRYTPTGKQEPAHVLDWAAEVLDITTQILKDR